METLPLIFAKDGNLDWFDLDHWLGGNLITKALQGQKPVFDSILDIDQVDPSHRPGRNLISILYKDGNLISV